MKACIVGAGAIGGFIGARLAAAGRADVSALARGGTLNALRQCGWRLLEGDRLVHAPARAADDAAELGTQDLVVIAVKTPALVEVANNLGPLIGRDTIVMPAMNGVPWWFVHGVPSLGEAPLVTVDPHGAVARAIAFERVVACVVHASAATVKPGVVRHTMGAGLIIGEPAGGSSDRVERVAALLAHAGFDVTQSVNVRHDIWYKLWGNMTINSVSAITGASADRLLADPLVRDFCSAAMLEAREIGARIGCRIDHSPEERHLVTEKLGTFRPSMLQDVEAGRPVELDALVGAVRELGERLSIATPNIDALFGLARLFARTRGLYPQHVGPTGGVTLARCGRLQT